MTVTFAQPGAPGARLPSLGRVCPAWAAYAQPGARLPAWSAFAQLQAHLHKPFMLSNDSST
jgi:hypothetical protein